jgi:2-keto-3-deoxy-L-rhamnonate aldolase RhmA
MDFCRAANETITIIVPSERVDALSDVDDVLAVSDLTSIVIGPAHSSAFFGYIA